MPTVGVIASGGESQVERFKTGMSENGFVEGRNIRFETRVARADAAKLSGFAQQLVEAGVDLIAAVGAVTARAAQSATSQIPIVYAVVVEPVGDGLATASGRPFRNMTGLTTFDAGQAQVHLRLLRSTTPDLSHIAYLADAAVSECLANANVRVAHEAGLRATVLRLVGPDPDLEEAFSILRRKGAQAIVALEHPAIGVNASQIADRARGPSIPSIFARDQAEAGGLFAYGTSLGRAAHAMAQQVSRVLGGEAPADMPIESLCSPELVIDMQTARDLGLTIRNDVLPSVTRVIDPFPSNAPSSALT